MTNKEYQAKKRECWEEFKRTNLDGEVQWQPVNRYDVFCAAFDRAYALGREKETITQEEIEKAAEEYSKHLGKSRNVTWNDAEYGFIAGANFTLGKQENDAEEEEILTCEKSKAMQLYSHLLDLIENERMSEHYSEWCDLEREYIALFGENVFADYFGSKCLPDAHEDNFARTEPKPAEPKMRVRVKSNVYPKNAESCTHLDSIANNGFREYNRLHIAAMAMQGILSNADRMKGYEHVATTPPCEELTVVVARNALRYADELLRQSGKGASK